MKAFTVSLEARITVMAHSEVLAIKKAKAMLGNSDLLMPTYVSDAYVHIWEPKEPPPDTPMPANCTQPKPKEDVDAIMNIYNKVRAEQAQQPPKTDDEVPF